ncbi:XRE family transcriptional regulator [Enterovirga rhinocerotis]|uniref:Peptidase S24-like protein n=1 Tax=Enterovirga rhinocerotis TaxID=1339210 RepID=A0A4R7BWN1_9HYPH|nr:LexA family transcriptional regulator [Enterovirga rhinocerotis]TDR90328.1 peptidase S24-like protein [Enterovirga rhinocerotis]
MANNLKRLRNWRGLSQEALAERMGTSRNQITKLEAGTRRLSDVWIDRAAPALDVDPGMLVSEKLDLEPRELTRVAVEHEDDDHARSDEPGAESGVSSIGPYRGTLPGAIPDLDAAGGAGPGENSLIYSTVGGNGLTYSADAVRGEIVLPSYLLSEFTRSKPGVVHAVRVRGDSMEMTLLSGDRVFADTNDHNIGQGGVFVIVDHRYGDEVLVKRLRRTGRGAAAQIVLVSDNPKQGDDERHPDEVTIVGRAIARLTRL